MLLNKLLSLQVNFVGFFDAKKSYITDGFIITVMMLYKIKTDGTKNKVGITRMVRSFLYIRRMDLLYRFK